MSDAGNSTRFRRSALISVSAFLLIQSSVSADLVGTEHQHRDDRRCAGIARIFRPHGISALERSVLVARSCSEDGYSTKVYQA